MIPTSMLLGMIKPLLPKLEGYLSNQENLDPEARAKIVMDVIDGQMKLQVWGVKAENLKKKLYTIELLQEIDASNLKKK